jgi:hypothetical protein
LCASDRYERLRPQQVEPEASLHLEEDDVDTTTLLIIIIIVLLVGGGGWLGVGAGSNRRFLGVQARQGVLQRRYFLLNAIGGSTPRIRSSAARYCATIWMRTARQSG